MTKMSEFLHEAVSAVKWSAIIVIAVVTIFALMSMTFTAIYSGTRIEYEGTVQTVTRSNFFAPHTRVVLRTYSEDDVHFTLGGYHDFNIGTQYKIKMIMKPYVFGINCWGRLCIIRGIQEVEN